MDLIDFKHFRGEKAWKRFRFLTANQTWYMGGFCERPEYVRFSFTRVDIRPFVSIIGFFDDSCNSLVIASVKCVECESDALGDILTITCKDGKKFVIVAQED